MSRHIPAAAAFCIATTLSWPAAADVATSRPPPYLWPEFSNYLSPPGAARCAWYDYCWYTLLDPIEYAVEAAPTVRRTRVRARH